MPPHTQLAPRAVPTAARAPLRSRLVRTEFLVVLPNRLALRIGPSFMAGRERRLSALLSGLDCSRSFLRHKRSVLGIWRSFESGAVA